MKDVHVPDRKNQNIFTGRSKFSKIIMDLMIAEVTVGVTETTAVIRPRNNRLLVCHGFIVRKRLLGLHCSARFLGNEFLWFGQPSAKMRMEEKENLNPD